MTASDTSTQSRSTAVLAVTAVVVAVSFLSVSLRLVTRIGIVHRFSWDDVFIVPAWLIAFGLSFSICYGTSRGLGKHEVDIPIEWEGSLKRSEYAFSVLYNPALMATKTSILIFYLNQLAKTARVFRWCSFATLIVVNAAGVALTLLNIFQCRPIGAVFANPLPDSAKCVDIVGLYLASAPVNIITDLAILFLPMPILTSLRLPKKQKTILVFTFALGGFVTIVDVVRIAYLQQAALQRLTDYGRGTKQGSRIAGGSDFPWYASLSFMWTAVEVNVGIVCACIPTLKPLVSRVMPSMLHDRMSNHSGSLPIASRATERTDQPLNGRARISSSSEAQGEKASPSSEPYTGGGDMDMIDFLTTPETAESAVRNHSSTTAATRQTHQQETFFDFVDMQNRKSMVKMTTREALVPLALVTILFFLWGFAYGLLDVLNSQFQLVVKMSAGQSTALHSSYYAGYFVASLTFARAIFRAWGFKATFITGLCVYGCGTLIFWPSSVLTSFPAFLVSNLIVGMGLGTLEVAANPFIALCGPAQYAEVRLLASQGVQAIATVVSPILAKRVLFKSVLNAPSLIDVQWAYLGIALFVVLLAVAFHYLPLPEASDDDLEDERYQNYSVNSRPVFGAPVIFITLALGVFSQFCYVGSQEGISIAFQPYAQAIRPGTSSTTAFNYQAVGHSAFAISRFLTAALCLLVLPRSVLLVSYIGSIITSALLIRLKGNAGIALLVLAAFFEAPIFPIIFALCLRGLGRHTKSASAFLTACVSGGAIVPAIMLPVSSTGRIPTAMAVPLAFFAAGLLFPLYLLLVPAAKAQVDPVLLFARNGRGDRPGRPAKRHSDVWKREKAASVGREEPTVEHIEGAASAGA